ncbi:MULTISPECIES: DUF6461 domain-containing protein [Streptomyces]|uniref:DUF6461 domain-containing protein n=1 Tax=Streptomyces fimbriatus TaxID=68197 RepID=A0ABW0DHD5_STRFI
MTHDPAERGLDLFRQGDFPFYTLTFARNLTPAELLTRMGGIPGTIALRDEHDMLDAFGDDLYDDGEPVVRAGTTGPWAWAREHGGMHGVDERILRTVSAGTEAVALHHNDKPVNVFAYAADGEVITTINTLVPVAPEGSDPQRLARYLGPAGLVPGENADTYGVLTLAENAFGIRFTGAHLDEEPLLSGLLQALPD